MQLDWNDLPLLAAFRRAKSFRDAGHILGVDATTVSRRVKAAEQAHGVPLIERTVSGQICLTAHGGRLADLGDAVSASLSGAPATAHIRLSAPPFLVRRVLAPQLAALPDTVHAELLSDPGNINLTRRQADIALRLARPGQGGHQILTRKVGIIRYVPAATGPVAAQRPWIGYDLAMGHLPHASWIEQQANTGARVTDLDAAMAATQAGAGPTLVPEGWVKPPLAAMSDPSPVSREIWMMTFRDVAHQRAVKQVTAWAAEAVAVHFAI